MAPRQGVAALGAAAAGALLVLGLLHAPRAWPRGECPADGELVAAADGNLWLHARLPDAAGTLLHIPAPLPSEDPGHAQTAFWAGYDTWERPTKVSFEQFVPSGGVYVGFGAWIGPTLLHAATRAARAYGLEPDPVAFASLGRNVGANMDRVPGTVEVYNECISDRKETLQMAGGGFSDSTLVRNAHFGAVRRRLDTFEVACDTLPRFLERHSIPADATLFVKIDTEGAERFVVPSWHAWLEGLAARPTLFVAIHSFTPWSQEEVERLNAVFRLFRYRVSLAHLTPGAGPLTECAAPTCVENGAAPLDFAGASLFGEFVLTDRLPQQ